MGLCPKCGALCSETEKFCGVCGEPLNTDEFDSDDIDYKNRPVAICAILSLIFSIIGVFSGGYGCLFSFLSIGTAVIFYSFSGIGIILGVIALLLVGNGKRKGKLLAIIGIVIGAAGLALWIVGSIWLKNLAFVEFGSTDLMDIIRVLLNR